MPRRQRPIKRSSSAVRRSAARRTASTRRNCPRPQDRGSGKAREELKKKHEEAEAHLAEVDALRAKEMERLETLAGLSQEDAREVLLHKVDEELTHEKAIRVAAYETDLKENCDGIARNLIGQAISRCAADHCSETTVSVVPLPSDEMKGRIIGREGRNIRALETPPALTLSLMIPRRPLPCPPSTRPAARWPA